MSAARWSFKRHLYLLVAAIAVPLAGSIAYQFHQIEAAARRAATQTATVLAERTAAGVGSFLDQTQALAARLAERPRVRAMDPARCDSVLPELLGLLQPYANFSVLDPDRRFVCSGRPLPTPPPVPLPHSAFDRALKGDASISEPVRGRLSGRWILAAAHPVRDDAGSVIGVVTVTVDAARLDPFLQTHTAIPGAIATVITGGGYVAARSQAAETWVGRNVAAYPALHRAASAGTSTTVGPGLDGVERIYAAAPINADGWRSVVGVPTAGLLAAAQSEVRAYTATVMLLVFLVALAALAVARRLAEPVQAMDAALRRMAEGERDTAVPEDGPREITNLARAVNAALAAEKEATARVAGIVATALDAIVTMDHEGRVLDFNPAAERVFGYSRAQALGGRLAELIIPPELREAHTHGLAHHLATGTSRMLGRRMETEAMRADGARFPIELNVSRIGSRTPPVFTGFIRDISERRRDEASLKRYADELQRLSRRLIEVEETERRSINRELHDRIGQNLSILNLGLNRLRARDAPPEDWREQIDEARTLAQGTIASIRNVMAELRPPALDDFGLFAALRNHADAWSSRTGIAAELRGGELALRPPLASETALFRIAQEALSNVAKHARARHAVIALERTHTGIVLTVADDGAGFDSTARDPARASWGIATMHERAQAIGASLTIESAPGKGTCVTVRIAPEPAP